MIATMPTGFVGHGNPMNALGGEIAAGWRSWGQALPRPIGILVVSAHFEAAPPTLGSTKGAPVIHDYMGFPDEMYALDYSPPPAPDTATIVERLLDMTVMRDEGRGLDHGAWVPLLHLFPEADIPVLQLSIPWTDDPAEMFALGARLAPLREDGIFVLGSGNLVHNLRRVDWSATGDAASWAEDFDGWLAETMAAGRVRDLTGYREHPIAPIAHPTHEHFVPVLVAAGAASGEAVRFPVAGFELGSISARSVEFGVS